MRVFYRRKTLASFVSAVLAMILAQNVARADYTFRPDPAYRTRSLAATVRIFATKTGGEQLGSGFVVDSGEGLILTAAHVIAELKNQAWVAFPRETTRHQARILSNNSSNSAAIDLGILKLDPAVDDVDSLELQFEQINPEQMHGVTGYGRSNGEPQEADARPSYTDACTFTIRAETLHGDSGSAVLTAEGLVDGIAVDGAESGGGSSMSEMKVLPLSCAMDQILSVVPDGQSEKIMATIVQGSDSALHHAFQPPPKAGWISNLRLAKAILGWVAGLKGQKRSIDDVRLRTAFEIIIQRHLGYQTAVAFSRISSASEKEIGGAFQKLARAESARGSNGNAQKAYAEAQKLYVQYASQHLPTTTYTISLGKSHDVAAAYKAMADTLIEGALISGNKEDFNKATTFAAAAVFYAPQGELKASSWATLGSASQEAGETSVAVSAYKAALDEGASAPWIAKDLVSAESKLGQYPQARLTPAFLDDGARAALTNIAVSSPSAEKSVKNALTESYRKFGDAVGKIAVDCNFNGASEHIEGTFFVFDKAGYALTAKNLFLADCQNPEIKVTIGSSSTTAALVKMDVQNQLALIKLAGGNYTPAKLSSNAVKSGEAVTAFGFELNQNVATAIGSVASAGVGRFLSLKSDLSPGLSGSPVFDSHGDVAGITIGANFDFVGSSVVPIAAAKPLVEYARPKQ